MKRVKRKYFKFFRFQTRIPDGVRKIPNNFKLSMFTKLSRLPEPRCRVVTRVQFIKIFRYYRNISLCLRRHSLQMPIFKIISFSCTWIFPHPNIDQRIKLSSQNQKKDYCICFDLILLFLENLAIIAYYLHLIFKASDHKISSLELFYPNIHTFIVVKGCWRQGGECF